MFTFPGLVIPHYNNSSKHIQTLRNIISTLEIHFWNEQYCNQLIPLNTFIHDKQDPLIMKQYLVYNKIILSAIPKLAIKRNQNFRVRIF